MPSFSQSGDPTYYVKQTAKKYGLSYNSLLRWEILYYLSFFFVWLPVFGFLYDRLPTGIVVTLLFALFCTLFLLASIFYIPKFLLKVVKKSKY
jgi:hypothetical protein